MRLLFALVLLINLAGCASPQSCALVPLAQMPIDPRDNLMFITAGIDGRGVRLIVDTGAERTTLTEAAVRRLGLSRDTLHATRSVGIGGMSADYDAFVPGVTLGQTRFPIERVAVGHFALDRISGPPVDGLLGADILLAFDMDIDVPAKRLTLYRVRRCPDAAPPWQEPAVEIIGLDSRRDRMLVPIELDGGAGLAYLDTGAQATTIGMAFARRLGLSVDSFKADRTITARGASPQPVTVPLHQFHRLSIGPAVMQAPTLAVAPTESGVGDALIGGDFLNGRRVWLSFPTRRLFVSRGAPTP